MAKVQTCYFPNSTSSPDVPCHSDAAASACCQERDTCLSNGLCLAQSGSEVISRGSCTDESWDSPNCPQYCADVNPGGGAPIFLAVHTDQWQYCCSAFSNGACEQATRGSAAPFPLEAGLVIFNRTSGSTSANISNVVTVTVPATATSTITVAASTPPSSSPPVLRTSLSCSGKEAAIGAGLGATLGLALLIALGLLWTERKHKHSLRTDAQTWEGRYNDLTTKAVAPSGAEHQPIHQLPAWTPEELDGRPKSLPSEMTDRPR